MFWDLLYFICLKFNRQYWYLLPRREKMCWFSSCLHKIFNTGSNTKVNCHEFYFFILDVKYTKLQSCLKIIHFTTFWTDQTSCLFGFFPKKKNFTSKNVDVMLCLCCGAYLNGISNVFVYLLIIFLGHDWFVFFLNKWGFIRFTL